MCACVCCVGALDTERPFLRRAGPQGDMERSFHSVDGLSSHTHVGNRETRTKQEKRLKENSSGTAELS